METLTHTTCPACHAALPERPKSVFRAVLQIVLADVSMSLDNVLAVAGSARNHFWVLAAGLVLSVALMGIASELVARLVARHHWIAWLGLCIVTAVALRMIYDGSTEIVERTLASMPAAVTDPAAAAAAAGPFPSGRLAAWH